jgi:hypothetical protein
LDSIASCQTFSADINISGTLGNAVINGVQKLSGNLNVNNATSLGSLAAPSLESISDSFSLSALTILSTLSFPKLTSVGSINWVTLPALSGLQFNSVVTSAANIYISDTGLTSLDGIDIEDVGTFNINNNRFLNDVTVNLKTISNSLDISFNAQQVSASFPALQWANNITFRDVSSVSLPNITNVNASLGFINNTFPGLSLPQLQNVGGSLAIVSNSKLSNISFPVLETIGGGFLIANNSDLPSVLGFPSVKSVGGAIDFTGDFNSAELPGLNLVKGGVNIDSNSDSFNCSSWNDAHSNGDIQGDSYVCKGASSSTSVAIHATQSSGSSSGSTTASATGSASKAGAAPVLSVESVSLFGAVAAFLFQFV